MSARRGSAARRKAGAFRVPAGSPPCCKALDDMTEADARDLIEAGRRYSIGNDRGEPCALVKCDGEGQPFRVLDGDGTVRAVTASWGAAARAMVALAIEHETGRVEGAAR